MIKKILTSGLLMLGALVLATSCNDEWKEEQYADYISFRAPLGSEGVTEIHVPYTRNTYDENGNLISPKHTGEGDNGEGVSDFQLPVIVSGSLHNGKNFDVHFAADPDTLASVNEDRFQNRTDLYYQDMSNYANYPEQLTIKSGEDVGILNVKFNMKGIDLVDKWVLPIQIKDDPSYNYKKNPRKNYGKAMLRVFPFNDWSGDYSATSLKLFVKGYENYPTSMETSRFYVVDENTVFFYAGRIDENRKDRKYYKIYAKFVGDSQSGVVNIWSDNPDIKLEVNKQATYHVSTQKDPVQDYLVRRYVIINNLSYDFVDYTSVNGYETNYGVDGSVTLLRTLNSQVTDPQYQIQW